MRFVKLPLTSVRYVTNRCLASICRREVIATMQALLEYTIECLENSEFNLFARQGAIELMHCLLESLGHDVIPFIVIFIVPILRRMCDIDWYVRSTASQCFATLVKLYPLSTSAASTDRTSLDEIADRNANIRRMREEQQGFLDQLMDQRKLKSYDLPNGVFINVKLRPYQQSGVDWLAFLKKFNLHGIYIHTILIIYRQKYTNICFKVFYVTIWVLERHYSRFVYWQEITTRNKHIIITHI